MKPSPPLRFLLLVGGGWVCLRAAALSPIWPSEAPDLLRSSPPPVLEPMPAALDYHAAAEQERPLPIPPQGPAAPLAEVMPPGPAAVRLVRPRPRIGASRAVAAEDMIWEVSRARPPTNAPIAKAAASAPPSIAPPVFPPPVAPRQSRWSGSAWAFVRQGGVPQLASGGTLGGSQAGARLLYRLNADPRRPLSISARAYTPLETKGAEAALGIEWQPVASIPVRLLAERRQSLSEGGRSAFSLLAHGGVYERPVAGPVLLDAFAQAGLVGFRSRDLFADGSAQLSLPAGWKGRLKAGAGIWAAAQPGVSRVDAGPQASMRFPIGRAAALRVSADWRFRLAGDAEPASGPALTVATEF